MSESYLILRVDPAEFMRLPSSDDAAIGKLFRRLLTHTQAPTVRDRHMSEKPEPMLRHFFRMLVDDNSLVLDPTCGSGSAIRAAESLGAKIAIGLEINEEYTQRARLALQQAREARSKESGQVPAQVLV
jgi:DNA modification methylase